MNARTHFTKDFLFGVLPALAEQYEGDRLQRYQIVGVDRSVSGTIFRGQEESCVLRLASDQLSTRATNFPD